MEKIIHELRVEFGKLCVRVKISIYILTTLKLLYSFLRRIRNANLFKQGFKSAKLLSKTSFTLETNGERNKQRRN